MDVPEPLRDLLTDSAPIERAAAAVALHVAGLRDEALLVMEEVLGTPVPELPPSADDFLPQSATAHSAVLEYGNSAGLLELAAPTRRLWEGIRDGDQEWNSAVVARALELLCRAGDPEAREALSSLAHLPVRVVVPLPAAPSRGWFSRLLRPEARPVEDGLTEEDLTPLPAEEASDARERATAAFCAARALRRLADPGETAEEDRLLTRLPLDLLPHLRSRDPHGLGALWFMAASAAYEEIRPLAPTFARVAAADGPVLAAGVTAVAGVLGDERAAAASVDRIALGPASVRGEEPAAQVAVAQMLTSSRDPRLRQAARAFLERCAALTDGEEDGDIDNPAWVLAADARDLLRYHAAPTGDPVVEAVRRVREGRPTDFVRWRY
ncbi:hypothetical protein L6R50_17560 [Myxococcota bacterium]|nr:hypothetical protein [Myxococcota bacterium]